MKRGHTETPKHCLFFLAFFKLLLQVLLFSLKSLGTTRSLEVSPRGFGEKITAPEVVKNILFESLTLVGGMCLQKRLQTGSEYVSIMHEVIEKGRQQPPQDLFAVKPTGNHIGTLPVGLFAFAFLVFLVMGLRNFRSFRKSTYEHAEILLHT